MNPNDSFLDDPIKFHFLSALHRYASVDPFSGKSKHAAGRKGQKAAARAAKKRQRKARKAARR